MHQTYSNTDTKLTPELGASIDTPPTVGGLLVDLNHELRTAMHGVVGMLELLGDTGLTDTQLRYLRNAQFNTNALQTLIDRISDLSLIESGRFRLASGPFDLHREAEAAVAGKAEEAKARGLDFSATLPSHSPALDGDAARVQALLSCLIDTMLCSARQGAVSVTLTTASDQPGMCRITLEIKAGPLAEEGRQLIAAMRQTGERDKATLRMLGRKALEPVLAAKLANLLGARIDTATDQWNVTTLHCNFVLPIVAHPQAHLRALLIAERAAEWQTLFAPFTAQGLQIDTLESAMDGLVALKRSASEGNPYRIVMLGARVQGMDATILASAIKGEELGRNAALVMLSERETEDEAALSRAGFSALISKSAPPDFILRALEKVWGDAANDPVPELVSAVSTATFAPTKAPATLPSACRRILIADDNPINREVAARLLEKLGYECALAADGREAVDMHRSQPYDLILMDCEMPQVDGFQATAIIRSLEDASARTPVIALTASTSQGEREKCLASGMDDFLSKPIRPQVLSEILARWFPRSESTSASMAPSSDVVLKDELDAVRAMFGTDFAELAHLYQRDTPPRIASLHRAYADGDHLHVAKVAHALGGSSASIGATGLSGLCRTIETQAKAGALGGFEQTMASIETEYRRICSKLQTLTT